MRITEQDERLFDALYQFDIVDPLFIEKYIYSTLGSKQYIARRIRMLVEAKYLEEIKLWHISPIDGREYRKVYRLGELGIDWVCSTIGEHTQLRTAAKDQATITRMIEIAHMVASFQQGGRGIVFINSERAAFQYGINQRGQIRPAGQLLVPVLVNNQSGYISYWIEFERTRGSVENLALNIKRYNQFLQFEAYKQQFIYDRPVFAFRVLSVARDDTSMHQQMYRIKDLKSDTSIFFVSKQNVLLNPLGNIYSTFDGKALDIFGNPKVKEGQ